MTTFNPATRGARPCDEAADRGRARSWLGLARQPHALLLVTTALGLSAGGLLHIFHRDQAAHLVWASTTGLALLFALWWVIGAAHQRRLGVDVLAVLALGGTLVVGEALAGAVIALMLASGRTLESWAAGRAERELRALIDRAPRRAHRRTGAKVEDVPIDSVSTGELLMVKPGEVVPVDGRVEGDGAVVDESALTGEPLPVTHDPGDAVRSGTVNAGGPFDLRTTSTAANSSYAGLLRLVAAAQQSSAPAIRLADRYAAAFVALSVTGAGVAWIVAGLARAVAVLVVATPCPLILAVPVALVAGLSRTAERGVIVKGGAVLERLARAKVLLFDKTGTLTSGRPTVTDTIIVDGSTSPNEVLRFAASVDQVSPHVLAAAIVRAAVERKLSLSLPKDVEEAPGRGIRGTVDGRMVAVGNADWVVRTETAWVRSTRRRGERDGRMIVFVALDGRPVGALLVDDPIRVDASRTIRRLREDGIARIMMVTGDQADVAETVGAVLGVDEVLADRSPAEKVDAVAMARRIGPTIMVGDGINDAPALALADVGVALGARGATASSEAADVVLSVDHLDHLGEAVVIARRSLAIATQSVVAGMGLSVAAMGVAGIGLLPATWGAIAQEFIDVAVILNALRVLRPGRRYVRLECEDAELARRFRADHVALRSYIEDLRSVADTIGILPTAQTLALARRLSRILVTVVLPHEQAEDAELYPMLARVLGGTDRTATMSRAHAEIAHLARRLGRLLDDCVAGSPTDEDLIELRRLLYGLEAILRLHTTQEDESYLSLADDSEPPRRQKYDNHRQGGHHDERPHTHPVSRSA